MMKKKYRGFNGVNKTCSEEIPSVDIIRKQRLIMLLLGLFVLLVDFWDKIVPFLSVQR